MFGISGQEFIVLLVAAAVILGPERLPAYTQQLANLVRSLRRMAQNAGQSVRSEMGPEFDDIDWRKLDPRQYDPRRIVRDALADSFDPNDPLGLKDMQSTIKGDIQEITDGFNGNGARNGSVASAGGTPDAATNGAANGAGNGASNGAANSAATGASNGTESSGTTRTAPDPSAGPGPAARSPRSFDDIT